MKIVLDTNVLISGLLNSQGNPAKIVALVLSGAIQICHDERILAEYREVLARPRFQFDQTRVAEVLTKLETDGRRIDSAPALASSLPDADDEPFLAVALAGSANYLVTGNIAHFPADRRAGVTVVTPAEFMASWPKTPPSAS